MRAVEESVPCGYPLDAAAVLIAEVDGPAAGLKRQADRIREACTKNKCREVRQAKDTSEREALWAGRRGAFGAVARLTPNYYVTDCTVPRTRLPEALARVAAVAEKYQILHGNVFHAGDGNLHPLLLFDTRDPDQVRRVHEAGGEIMKICVALGGTITGEHGIGAEKLDAMRMVFSEDDLDVQRSLRKAFDPADLLNPGKIIPPSANAEEPVESTRCEIRHEGELIPIDVVEACGGVQRAFLDRVALLPMGSGTRSDFGNYSERAVIPLLSSKLTATIDYDPVNQVVTVGSGMSLSALQDLLAQGSQWLPLRPPMGGKHTVGGMVALSACGPERLAYGATRDRLLGLQFVSGTGRVISAGGRVVKNVAGYDLTRLLAGSAGTLGFITALTFRVSAVPECCIAVLASGSLEQCGLAAAGLLRSKLIAAFIAAVPDSGALAINSGAWRLIAGFEGFEETVNFQIESCSALLESAGLSMEKSCEYPVREGMCGEFFEDLERYGFVLRADLPLDKVVGFISCARDLLPEAAVLVDFGCGRVTAATSSLKSGAWTQAFEILENAEGHAVLEKAPEHFKKGCDVFGPPGADWQLMHKIKAGLDPHNIFAPGRLPGGK